MNCLFCNLVQTPFGGDDQKVVEEVEVDADEGQSWVRGLHTQLPHGTLVHQETPTHNQRDRLEGEGGRLILLCNLRMAYKLCFNKIKCTLVTLTLPKSSSISRLTSSSICLIFRIPMSHAVTICQSTPYPLIIHCRFRFLHFLCSAFETTSPRGLLLLPF